MIVVNAIRRRRRYSLGTGTAAWVGRYWLLPGWIVFVRREASCGSTG